MSEGRDGDDDILGDYWITSWEQQAVQELENEQDHQQSLHAEADAANEKMWILFQNAAQCVAVMYKGAADSQNSMWVPFQTAAGHITALYKDSVEHLRRSGELGVQAGYQRRTREVLNWARRRRHFRREELIAFLAGKSPPPKTSHLRGSPRTRITLERISPRLPSPHHHAHMHSHNPDPELTTFREALGISGQTGLNVRPQPVGSPTLSSRRRNSTHLPELQAFLCDEFARNKRPAPSSSPTHDVTMDSPQHKRSRFT
ncbi:HUWE1-associated protein modifying stress responses [Macrobrachium rosenbergii]|uniref:HUWE1-associated protein modifying stress responses n=1 Tax=Macrobrachium rosenbergii TaxID=79674 RepID=UPI0034D581B1